MVGYGCVPAANRVIGTQELTNGNAVRTHKAPQERKRLQPPRDAVCDGHFIVGLVAVAQLVPASILLNSRKSK